jgi:hypothetical protein
MSYLDVLPQIQNTTDVSDRHYSITNNETAIALQAGQTHLIFER